MKWFLQRLAEPSTHAGIAAMLSAVAIFYPPAQPICAGLAALFGGAAVVTPEQKS